jgi:hypothetical protein
MRDTTEPKDSLARRLAWFFAIAAASAAGAGAVAEGLRFLILH